MISYHSEFDTLSETPVPEYRATGVLLRHRATGCEVYHLRSEDEENTFAFCFRTPPEDSTGVAHIVEHSVLCGSERFPVKDAFLALARGSLATFLNAFTYPDKTVYPAASTVEADYFHLMDVYGDAVFHPRITKDIFLQEAHHLEYGEDGRLDRKGVVYNEMRGDYSSPESLVATRTYEALFSPGHPYHEDSGGDPEVIPELTYKRFRDFWESHYHPSNCRIFLHGNIPTDRQLEFLNAHFLSAFQRRDTHTEVPLQQKYGSPVRRDFPFPAEEGSDSKITTLISWLTVPSEEGTDSLTLEILSEILLGSDGAPLAHALMESGLGEDLSPHCGLDTGIRQAVFSAGLRGVERGREEAIESLVLDCVRGVAREGIAKDLLEAAFHSVEFSAREIRRGGGTYGLRLLSRAIRGWLHGGAPEQTLSFETPLEELKSRMASDSRYLEKKLLEWIVDNPHRVTVTVYPDAGLAETQRGERRAALDALEKGLDDSDRGKIREKAAALKAFQEAEDDEKAQASIPRLLRKDIPSEIELVPRRSERIRGASASVHTLFTNGIVYADFAFPLDALPESLYPYLPLLSRFVSGAGLPGQGYDEVARRLALYAGGFSVLLQSGTPAGGRLDAPSSWMVFRLKALEKNFPQALNLAVALMTGADFGDIKRVKDLLAELSNDVAAAIVPSGSAFASARAGAVFSSAQRIDELWRGLSQFLFLSFVRSTADPESLARDLAGTLGAVVAQAGMRINLTLGQNALENAISALETALPSIPLQASPAPAGTLRGYEAPPERFEAWTISAQVGFSAVSLPASPLGTPQFAHEQALGHLLSTSILWDTIRVKGGAYGASAWTDGSESTFSFSSYRDPSPVASLDAYRSALDLVSRDGVKDEDIEKAVVGAAGRDLRPMMPEEKGFVDFKRELYDVSDDIRRRKRADLLGIKAQDLRDAARRILAGWEERSEVLISHEDDIKSVGRAHPTTIIHQLQI